MLSGTPCLTGPGDLFPALHYLRPDRWPDRRAFDLEYGAAPTDDPRNLTWLHADARQVLIRREKNLIVPKIVRELAVELSPQGWASYHKAEQRVQDLSGGKRAVYSATDVVPLNRAMQMEKLEAAWQVIDQRLAQGRQVLLFSQFTRPCDLTQARYGAQCVSVHGQIRDRRERAARAERFQRGEARVYTGTIESNGTALTLTAADTVLMLEQGWVPEIARQAEDRAHRHGTPHEQVEVWYLVCPGTCDEHLRAYGAGVTATTSAVLAGRPEYTERPRVYLPDVLHGRY